MAVVHFHNRHTSKNQTVKECIKFHIDYAKNPEKTQNGLLVSAYGCSPETAAEEFLISKKMYEMITKRSQLKDKDNISYMLMQSFKPEEITPQKAHEIGYQFAYEFTKGEHQFVVSTHTDKEHIHNHVEFNSTSLDCTHKFNAYKRWGISAQKLSDKICKEHCLSTVKEPQQKSKQYAEWKAKKENKSWKQTLKSTIDEMIPQSKNFEDFIENIRKQGYEVKQGKQISFRVVGQNRFTRMKTLGAEYTETAIAEKIKLQQSKEKTIKKSITSFIDIEQKKKDGKGAAYEQWAKIFNVKQAANTVNFLTENNVDYQKLEQQVQNSTKQFNEISNQLKQKEKQIKEVLELKTNIIYYARTIDIYKQYQKTKDKQNFKKEHNEDIIKHEKAKAFFEKTNQKKLPKVKELQQQNQNLLAEKQQLYQQYTTAKKEMLEYQTAKQNMDKLLQTKQKSSEKDQEI
ncbi:relaxase/mobilization nuclease domain-containing protein [Clostridium sp. MD294]|uniref:relaxase/mobilization nuclease domain-containing protein n=1 Tax=Clostridium sp. MD294 TaxID=97138 RepID=UPI0002C9CA0E|nr:relaxase/mobilization nuclease domain-containing protein [Clostridium sp. MD294]USF31306.1 hypothetical protein C820_002752 [Clostridium sp. MD294]